MVLLVEVRELTLEGQLPHHQLDAVAVAVARRLMTHYGWVKGRDSSIGGYLHCGILPF